MITVYSSSTCPACEGLKMKLRSWDIDFDVKSLDTDADAKQELLSNGFRTVPQLKVNGTFVKNIQTLTKADIVQ